MGTDSLLQLYLACFIHHAVPAVAISQIQSNGQFLLRNIPALRCCSGANLLHCRSPFYLCLEHVDNLGAYSIPFGDRPSPSKTTGGGGGVKQLRSALELPCSRVVGAASLSTALARRSECG